MWKTPRNAATDEDNQIRLQILMGPSLSFGESKENTDAGTNEDSCNPEQRKPES